MLFPSDRNIKIPYIIKNVINTHSVFFFNVFSDSQVTAMREIKFFYPNFNPDLWYKTEHKLFMHDMVYFDHDLFEHHSSYSKNYIENVAPS